MNDPQIIVNHLQINIKIPEQLHTVQPSPHKKSKPSTEHEIQVISQDAEQDIKSSPHKIRHIESIDDKGEFIDENRQSRVSDNDELKQTINRVNYPEIELTMNQQTLQKIEQQGNNQETGLLQLKHLNIQKDKDQFNLASSRSKQCKRKRRLSESNLPSYSSVKNQFSLAEYLNQQQKRIPQRIEKIMEEEAEVEKKQRNFNSPLKRDRKKSVHTVHRGSSPSVSQEFKRMIVDQLDKKKKSQRKQQQMQEEKNETQMERIIQEKQQEDNVNIQKLEQARQKIEQEISCLTRAVEHSIEPEYKETPLLEKKETIHEEDPAEQKDD